MNCELRISDSTLMKAAIFDVDGTILDTMDMWAHLAKNYLATLGIYTSEDIDRKFLSATIDVVASYMKEKYSLDLSEAEIKQGVIDCAADFYFTKAQIKEGMLEFIMKLKEKSIPMVIASSGEEKLIKAAFERLDLMKYFSGIYTGDKNTPDLFNLCLKKLGTNPQETFVFEDGIHAIETAKKMGLKTVAVKDIQENFSEIKKIADYNWEAIR